MLPTKFQINWPFLSGEEGQNRFSIWPPWWPSWISYWNDFSYFCKSPRCFLPSLESIGLSVQKKRFKDFQNGHHGSHLGFPIGTILAIFDLQVTLINASYQVLSLLASRFRRRSKIYIFKMASMAAILDFLSE